MSGDEESTRTGNVRILPALPQNNAIIDRLAEKIDSVKRCCFSDISDHWRHGMSVSDVPPPR